MKLYVLLAFILLFSSTASPQPTETSKQDDMLQISIESLADLICDSYSTYVGSAIYDLSDNRKLVLLIIEGFCGGNNYYSFLAVFEKTQKKKNISGEQYESYGPKKYKLLGYIQAGGKHCGSIDLRKTTVENDNIDVFFKPSRSGLTMINSEIYEEKVEFISLGLGEHGLRVENTIME